MPKLRIKDLRPSHGNRKQCLWNKLMTQNLLVYQLKALNGAFLIISSDEIIEKLLTTNVKDSLKKDNFEVQTPPEYVASKTIVIRNIDSMVSEVEAEELKGDLERRNDWLKVEEVVKLPNAPKILKVRVKEISMAKKAIDKGLLIYNQSIPPHCIEKEIFVQLSPCYKCYRYNHKTEDCPTPDITLCSECASNSHTFRECNNQYKKCINCGGSHRTFAARCPTRKSLIKDKAKEIRERSRSRSRSRPRETTVTYAEAASKGKIESSNVMTRDEHIKITSSITYGLMMEGILPGSFQETVEEMYRLNNLPKVKFPSYIPPVQIGSEHLERELERMRKHYKAAREGKEYRETDEDDGGNKETESDKRKRETPSPTPQEQREPRTKIRREQEIEETIVETEEMEEEIPEQATRMATPPRVTTGALSLPRQQLVEGGGEDYADNESIPELENEDESQEAQKYYEKRIADMGYCFVITRDTTVKKGDLTEIKELLRTKKTRFIITNPKYKEAEARILWERGLVDLRKTELKVISREAFNSIEANGKYLNIRRHSTGSSGKRR